MNPDGLIDVGKDNPILQRIFPAGGGHFGELVSIGLYVIGLLMALVAITAVVVLAINIVRWSKAGDNPSARSEAQRNMLICGICLAIIGGFGTVYAIFVMLML